MLLVRYPAQTSESTQAVDSELGRSARIEVGNSLDVRFMEEENMLKWEGKMMASKGRVLINHLIAKATEKVLKKDEMRAGCFARTDSLLQWIKSEAGNLIKPQCIKSKIIAPDCFIEDEEISEFAAPSATVAPQEENIGKVATCIAEDSIANIVDNMSVLIMHEDENEVDLELRYREVIEDASIPESIEEFEFQG